MKSKSIAARLFGFGILAILFVYSASAQTPQFAQIAPLYFTMPAGGQNPLPQTLTLASTGSTIYLQVSNVVTATTANGGNWLNVTGCKSICSTPSVYSIGVDAPALQAGSYSGQVVFNSGSAAVTVPVTLIVVAGGAPFLSSITGGLSFVAGSGFTPAPQNVQIINAATGSLSWTASVSIFKSNAIGTVNWLGISASSGTAPSLVSVAIPTTQGLAPGIYLGQVLFQAATSSITIPVTLQVTDANNVAFQQLPALNFTMPAGGQNPLPQTLTLASTGSTIFLQVSNVVTASTGNGGNWLNVTGCKSICSTPSVYSIGVDAPALQAGSYSGQVVLNSGSTAVTVPVTLTVVGAGVPFLSSITGGLNFVAGSGFTPAPQNVQIINAGTGSLSWTASVSIFRSNAIGTVNWLGISSPSGTAPSLVSVAIPTTQGLAPGIYLGQIVFQAATSSITIPVTLQVTDANNVAFQQLPALNFTMPAGGQNPLPQTLTLASTGSTIFLQVSNVVTASTGNGGNWLNVTGCKSICSTPSVYSIGVDAPALQAGSYSGQVVLNSGSTAVTVPVTLTVVGAGVPFLGSLTGGLNFVAGSGFTPAPQNVQIINAGTGSLSWTASVSIFRSNAIGTVNWLGISSPSGTAPSLVSVAIPTTQGLAPGIYLGQVLFQAATSSMTIPVTLQVTDANNVAFQQLPPLIFTMPAGGQNPLPQTLTLASTGSTIYLQVSNVVTATTANGGNWLNVTGCKSVCSTPSVYSIGVDAPTLQAGSYSGEVVYSSGSATLTLPVTLMVGNPFGPSPSITGTSRALMRQPPSIPPW